MSEVCSRCGQICAAKLYLQNKKGEKEPLCKNCTEKFHDSGEEWPQKTITSKANTLA